MAFGDVFGADARRAGIRQRPGDGGPRTRHRRSYDSRPYTPQAGTCRELDCVRGILPRQVIAAAEQRARAIGMGADRVLICADAITEDAYLHALAASLGTSYDRLETLRRSDVPLSDAELIRAAVAGLMPIRKAGRIVWIIAPSCWAAHRLTDTRAGTTTDPFVSTDLVRSAAAFHRSAHTSYTRPACRLRSAPRTAAVFQCGPAACWGGRRHRNDHNTGFDHSRTLSRRRDRHLFGHAVRGFPGSGRTALVERAVQTISAGTPVTRHRPRASDLHNHLRALS